MTLGGGRRRGRAGLGNTMTLMHDQQEQGTRTVESVVAFEDLPMGSTGSRRAVVRWSDGSQGEALGWYADEVLVCEGDLIGKTQAELRSLHFRRDRDWLQS
jgi:hypothetical protein